MTTMHTCVRWHRAILAFVPLMTFHMTHAQEFDRELMKRSSVTFIGTILQRNAVSFGAVPRTEQTAVVRADQVLEKPIAIALNNGDTLTVQLNDPAALPEGTRAIFYAEGWIVGTGIALREIGHTVLDVQQSAAAQEQNRERYLTAKRQVQDDDLRARLVAADVVAYGSVVHVRRAEKPGRFITEHDPEWHEAVVQVRTAIKGVSVGEQIVVRFPGAMDVAFYRWPRFKEGDDHLLIASRDTITGLPQAMVAGKPVEAYVVGSAVDVLPKEELERAQRLVK